MDAKKVLTQAAAQLLSVAEKIEMGTIADYDVNCVVGFYAKKLTALAGQLQAQEYERQKLNT